MIDPDIVGLGIMLIILALSVSLFFLQVEHRLGEISGRLQLMQKKQTEMYEKTHTDALETHGDAIPCINEEEEANMDKPRICEVLGVEVGEWFTYPGMITSFQVTKSGFLKCADGDLKACVPILVNHPENIIRNSRFTGQEIEIAKKLKGILGGDKKVFITEAGKTNIGMVSMEKTFPSIKEGEEYTLDEIIGGAE